MDGRKNTGNEKSSSFRGKINLIQVRRGHTTGPMAAIEYDVINKHVLPGHKNQHIHKMIDILEDQKKVANYMEGIFQSCLNPETIPCPRLPRGMSIDLALDCRHVAELAAEAYKNRGMDKQTWSLHDDR